VCDRCESPSTRGPTWDKGSPAGGRASAATRSSTRLAACGRYPQQQQVAESATRPGRARHILSKPALPGHQSSPKTHLIIHRRADAGTRGRLGGSTLHSRAACAHGGQPEAGGAADTGLKQLTPRLKETRACMRTHRLTCAPLSTHQLVCAHINPIVLVCAHMPPQGAASSRSCLLKELPPRGAASSRNSLCKGQGPS
jgi:hypothetical protein